MTRTAITSVDGHVNELRAGFHVAGAKESDPCCRSEGKRAGYPGPL